MKRSVLSVRIICGFLISICGCTVNTKEIFLIPEGFLGKVKVSFNHHKDGTKQAFEPHAYVFHIPADGNLRTAHVNDRCDNPIKERLFYYINKQGTRKQIPIADKNRTPSDVKAVKIYDFKTDYVSKRYPPYNILYECYYTFMVNSYDNLRKAVKDSISEKLPADVKTDKPL
jgi:hypothetical protein